MATAQLRHHPPYLHPRARQQARPGLRRPLAVRVLPQVHPRAHEDFSPLFPVPSEHPKQNRHSLNTNCICKREISFIYHLIAPKIHQTCARQGSDVVESCDQNGAYHLRLFAQFKGTRGSFSALTSYIPVIILV